MNWTECVLRWLEHFKPLWDFMTAIGTVGAVLVSLWLALRKPWVRFRPSVRLQGGAVHFFVTNRGEPGRLLSRLYIAVPTIEERLEIYGPGMVNGRGSFDLPKGLATGDIYQITVNLGDLARDLDRKLTEDGERELQRNLVRARFICTTTTDESFSTRISRELATAWAEILLNMRAAARRQH